MDMQFIGSVIVKQQTRRLMRPKLKLYLFPLTWPTLKKGPTQNMVFLFSVKNIFLLYTIKSNGYPIWDF